MPRHYRALSTLWLSLPLLSLLIISRSFAVVLPGKGDAFTCTLHDPGDGDRAERLLEREDQVGVGAVLPERPRVPDNAIVTSSFRAQHLECQAQIRIQAAANQQSANVAAKKLMCVTPRVL